MWTAINAIVLVVLSGWVFHLATRNDSTAPRLSAEELLLDATPTVAPSIAPTAKIPTKAEFMAAGAQHFGVSYAEAPFNKTKFAAITRNAGAPPTMLEYFIKWTEEFRPVAATTAYDQGAIPVVAWEPWAGVDKGINQPKYALGTIIDGTARRVHHPVRHRREGLPVADRAAVRARDERRLVPVVRAAFREQARRVREGLAARAHAVPEGRRQPT